MGAYETVLYDREHSKGYANGEANRPMQSQGVPTLVGEKYLPYEGKGTAPSLPNSYCCCFLVPLCSTTPLSGTCSYIEVKVRGTFEHA